MTAIAKSAKSLLKKNVTDQKLIAVGIKKVLFAHKAAAGETEINVNSLTLPDASEVPQGFVQPTVNEILNARMFFFRNNIRIVSSDKGLLQQGGSFDYTVSSSSLIKLNFSTVLDEVFHVYIEPVAKTGSITADVDPVIASGTLSAGNTDIIIGKSKKIINTSEQIGAVQLILNGQVLLRNVGNATAAPSADGNYEEVDNGAGEFTVVRLNNSLVTDQPYLVTSTALDVIRPEGSVLDQIESQQGTIDLLVDAVAPLAGVPTTDFQAAPTTPQLKQFGERMVRLESFRLVSSAETLDRKPVDRVLADTLPGAFTLTLPLSPVIGDVVEIWDTSGTFNTQNLTVGRNGQNIMGAASDLVLSTQDQRVKLVYSGVTRGWLTGDIT